MVAGVRSKPGDKSRAEADKLEHLYAAAVREWRALHEDLNGVLQVGACGHGNGFPPIDEHTAVGLFLTYRDSDTNDVLIKVRPCVHVSVSVCVS